MKRTPWALWVTIPSVVALIPWGGCGQSLEGESRPRAQQEVAPADVPDEREAPEPPEESEAPPSPVALTPFETFGSADAINAWVAELRAPPRARRGRLGAGAARVTNVQEEGVGEGSIVQRAGDHLVVLRRGRLFTVRVEGDALMAVDQIDVPRDVSGRSRWSWYDEMLFAGTTVAVVGYTYGQGTEVLLFDLALDGTLSRGPSYVLRSGDYWSSRNYASRLIGNELLLYMPIPFMRYRQHEDANAFLLPALRAQPEGDSPQGDPGDWQTLIEASEIFRPVQHVAYPMLHTVIRCDLTTRPLRCRARGIVGPSARTFYVSPNAVYVWARQPRWYRRTHENTSDAVVYRWPHDGSAPGALRVTGRPIDQLSFTERGEELNVAVRAGSSANEGMFGPETSSGDFAMTRIPLAALSGGIGDALPAWYVPMPRTARTAFRNRFVGEHYLYGTGSGWGAPTRARTGGVYVHNVAEGSTERVELGHSVDRIEQLGESTALVVGAGGGDLGFTQLALSEAASVITAQHLHVGGAQGETRTHGFSFRDEGSGRGTLGLPVRSSRRGAWRQLFQSSAGVVYLDVGPSSLTPIGALSASSGRTQDRCVASCVDWYGNSRPVFLEDRAFALLGYELVEGSIGADGIVERRRLNLFDATDAPSETD